MFTALISQAIVAQLAVLGILVVAMTLFIRNRLRYDVVALLVMLVVVLLGILEFEAVFANFGHPAIIIVASMFVMSEAFVRSGIVDAIVGRLTFLYRYPILGLGFMVIIVTLTSAFVNNAGALAMSIPIALHLARKSNTPIAFFLLPMALASHLGGFLTLIGTPRNIIISNFRESATGIPFGMFDFLPVGGGVALVGCIFLIAVAWRIIPLRKPEQSETPIRRAYLTEVSIPKQSKVAGITISKFEKLTKNTVSVEAVYRVDSGFIAPTETLGLLADDVMLIKGEIDVLAQVTKRYYLSLTGRRAVEQYVTNEDDYVTIETVVPPYSKLTGSTWNAIELRKRFGTNFIGLYRTKMRTFDHELAEVVFLPNDILLLQGRRASVDETINSLRLLPIAHTESDFGKTTTMLAALAIIVGGVAIASLQIIPIAVVFLATALLLVTTNLVSLRQAYDSVDATVLVLLAGMITLGDAMQASGAAATIANAIGSLDGFLGPIAMLILVLIVSMLLSDFMNSTASAVIMAPIAILVAENLQVSLDPFLMAVAIGASCAFLTPIGHESNAIVMRQGGYTFSDFFRVGLPLELLIIATTIPLILYAWPF